MILLLLIYLILFAFLIGTVYIARLKPYHTFAKTVTSLVFVVVSVYGCLHSGDSRFFLSMLPALIFCLAGDFFLSLTSAYEFGLGFLAGLTAFTIGHVLFLVAFIRMTPIIRYEFIIPVLVVAAVYIITRGPGFNLGNFTIPILIYGFLVAWTFSRSVIIVIDAGATGRTLSLLIGSLLFMISDVILLFIYFYKRKFSWMSFFNLASYYTGMFLLAASVYFS